MEGSGSIPMTIGSGSGSNRPKNRRIRIRIRIRNTGLQVYTLLLFTMADREGYTMHTAGGENGYSGVRVSPVPILLVTDQPGTAQLCSLVNLNLKRTHKI